MSKRKSRKMCMTNKQKEASKHNWTIFQIRGVIGFMKSGVILNYSSKVQEQASKIKGDLEGLLVMIKEENANNKG